MTDEQIEKMFHIQQRLLLIIGYSASFICDVEIKTDQQRAQYDWLMNSIENIVYLDKPLLRMP